MQWHFLLHKDDEHDQHAGFAMATLVTKGDYPHNEYNMTDLRGFLYFSWCIQYRRMRVVLFKLVVNLKGIIVS